MCHNLCETVISRDNKNGKKSNSMLVSSGKTLKPEQSLVRGDKSWMSTDEKDGTCPKSREIPSVSEVCTFLSHKMVQG